MTEPTRQQIEALARAQPLLYSRNAGTGVWSFNQAGTLLQPNWVACSPTVSAVLNEVLGVGG